MLDGDLSELHSGERQVAETIDGIRRDHAARYEWAAERIMRGQSVLDVGCGVGYGAALLKARFPDSPIVAVDKSVQALDFGRRHFAGPEYRHAEMSRGIIADTGEFDVAICFEIVEHLADPRPLLWSLRRCAGRLLISVPNEDGFPYRGIRFHFRHYTAAELDALLRECGWGVYGEPYGQANSEAEVAGYEPGVRTIVAEARPVGDVSLPADEWAAPPEPAGKHIAIIGLGPSAQDYVELARRYGGRTAVCDEVWTINALGDVLGCDLVIHMDDVRVQEIRAADPKGPANVRKMLGWMRRPDGPPIITSRAHPDYPRLVEFPLADVLSEFGNAYFNSTAAYAVALAIHRGASQISLFGIDFTYPNYHHAEKGRACVEYWLGVAQQRGIAVTVAVHSSLMDACEPPAARLYGYDTVDLLLSPRPDGGVAVEMRERELLPTAAEIEARYDHFAHPNPLVSKSDGEPAADAGL